MICTSVMLCLSTDLAKNDKIMSMFVPFFRFFCHFESLAFFPKWGDKPYTKAVNNNKVTIFKKSQAILTKN